MKPETVEIFAREFADRLGVGGDHVIEAFEDPVHWMMKEAELPINVDPLNSKIDDPEERARMARVFERGLSKPAGFGLPVQRWNASDQRRWISDTWAFRRGRLYLIPGDFPVGFRLPIGSLPYIPQSSYPFIVPQDPMEERAPLPDPQQLAQLYSFIPATKRQSVFNQTPARRACERRCPSRRATASLRFHAACREARDYLELSAALEPPPDRPACPFGSRLCAPHHPCLQVIKVTPDPGVIELNVQPSTSWRQSVEITTALYEERANRGSAPTNSWLTAATQAPAGAITSRSAARRPRLALPTPAGFVEEPHSLCAAPSLAVLSLLWPLIGPTSQAPGIDEARHDALYELEIAMAQVPSPGEGRSRCGSSIGCFAICSSMRRAIRIGPKSRSTSYSPDGPAGRFGLVEFRAFEMPPDARMSLAQQLLLRALVAWLWREPQQAVSCAGAQRSTIVSCCPIFSGRICSPSSAIS